jgi:hypothetical protein
LSWKTNKRLRIILVSRMENVFTKIARRIFYLGD